MDSKKAFGELLKNHLNLMYTVALRFTKNREDAQDLVAESTLLAWKHFSKLKDKNKFKSWILRILTNQYINDFRRRKSLPTLISVNDDMENENEFSLFEALSSPLLFYNHNPEKLFVEKMLASDITKAIDSLPEQFRIIFTLCELEDIPYQTAADMLNLPVGTVRSRLSRARSKLQKSLFEWAKEKKYL